MTSPLFAGTPDRTSPPGITASSRARRAVVVMVAAVVTLLLGLPETALAEVGPGPESSVGVSGAVYAVAQVGDRTVIGGDFDAVGGVPRNNVAAIRADGSLDADFDPGANGPVRAVAASPDGSLVYVGGDFSTLGGAARANLGAVDPVTGAAVDTWRSDTDNTVFALAVSGDRLYAGGRFRTVGNVTLRRLAALDTTTGAVHLGFNPWPNWTVKAVVVSPDGTKVYAVGGFTAIGGASRTNGAAEVLAATGRATGFAPSEGGVALAAAITPDGSRFFFATTNNRLWAYDPAVSNDPVYVVQTSGDTQAIAASATEVYFGGHFSRINKAKAKRSRIASVYVSDGSLTDWNPGANGRMGVWATAVTPTHLLVGGEFSQIGGSRQAGFARFTGQP